MLGIFLNLYNRQGTHLHWRRSLFVHVLRLILACKHWCSKMGIEVFWWNALRPDIIAIDSSLQIRPYHNTKIFGGFQGLKEHQRGGLWRNWGGFQGLTEHQRRGSRRNREEEIFWSMKSIKRQMYCHGRKENRTQDCATSCFCRTSHCYMHMSASTLKWLL